MSDHIECVRSQRMLESEIPDLYIVAIYRYEEGFCVSIDEQFGKSLRLLPVRESAQKEADILECLRRALNTARGVA